MNHELRNIWNLYFHFNWKFGLALILLICIPRFYMVLIANQTGNYSFIGLIMLVSALVPFIFLGKYGRKQIGITRTQRFKWLLFAFILGILGSLLLYVLGKILFGTTYHNWYVYIGKSYNISENIGATQKLIQFAIMAITGMTFSPIGEELFFRGIVHGSFAKTLGDKRASLIDSAAFAFTHLSHFGLVYVNMQWNFYALPALLWITGMFLVSFLFFKMKQKTASIWGAVLCHAGFNLGMIFSIFYWL